MFAAARENIKKLYNHVVEVPGLKFKIVELILSLIAYCKTLTYHPFGYLEIFSAQVVILGTFTVLQAVIIMRFYRLPPHWYERVVLRLYGMFNIICAVRLALEVYQEQMPDESMEIIRTNLECKKDMNKDFYLDSLMICLYKSILGIILVFDSYFMEY